MEVSAREARSYLSGLEQNGEEYGYWEESFSISGSSTGGIDGVTLPVGSVINRWRGEVSVQTFGRKTGFRTSKFIDVNTNEVKGRKLIANFKIVKSVSSDLMTEGEWLSYANNVKKQFQESFSGVDPKTGFFYIAEFEYTMVNSNEVDWDNDYFILARNKSFEFEENNVNNGSVLIDGRAAIVNVVTTFNGVDFGDNLSSIETLQIGKSLDPMTSLHEIGHILGLSHVFPPHNLGSSNANLKPAPLEIRQAYGIASKQINNGIMISSEINFIKGNLMNGAHDVNGHLDELHGSGLNLTISQLKQVYDRAATIQGKSSKTQN